MLTYLDFKQSLLLKHRDKQKAGQQDFDRQDSEQCPGRTMYRFLLIILLAGSFLAAQGENSQFSPSRVEYEKQVPPLPLRKMVDAAILMLEARAYEQFILAYVAENDRRKFEKAYTREDRVDYERWGEEKAGRLLNNLRSLAAAEAVVTSTKVCYYKPGESESFFSFVRERGMWRIENSTRCPERKEVKPSAKPQGDHSP